MTAQREHSGDLCGVRVRRDHIGVAIDYACGNLAAETCDVPLFRASGRTIELALCIEHLAELHESPDPIETARGWLLDSVAP
jgi:hypothetical protein